MQSECEGGDMTDAKDVGIIVFKWILYGGTTHQQ